MVESILMRFAMWIRLVVDADQCNYEASVNSGSAHLTVSACGRLATFGMMFMVFYLIEALLTSVPEK